MIEEVIPEHKGKYCRLGLDNGLCFWVILVDCDLKSVKLKFPSGNTAVYPIRDFASIREMGRGEIEIYKQKEREVKSDDRGRDT